MNNTGSTDLLNKTASSLSDEFISPESKVLHDGGLTREGIDLLWQRDGFHIVQIGVHTGFEIKTIQLLNAIQYILDQAKTEFHLNASSF